jgi:RNA polymerase sigma factor for flagellar operon FliA
MDPSSDRLVAEYQGLVKSIAWKIAQKLPSHVDMDDLTGYGYIGLTEAARNFDSGRGGKFSTYAYHRIRGAILDGLGQMAWFKLSDYHRGQYEQLARDTMESEGDDSSQAGQSLADQATWLEDVCTRVTMVQILSSASDARVAGEAAIADSQAGNPASIAIEREIHGLLHKLIDELSPPADELVRATYFEGISLKEFGERQGKSKSWASRLHSEALRDMARGLRRVGAG